MMRIETKVVDPEYLEFLSFFCRTIGDAYFEPNYGRIQDKINDFQQKYLKTFFQKGRKTRNYIATEYLVLADTLTILPPACRWISESGRFCCVDIYFFAGDQSYILWDNNRKVALPIIFRDLTGMDEENDIIFCRTMNQIHRHDAASPLHINLDWINLCGWPESRPDEYPTGKKHNYSYEELLNIAYQGIVPIENYNNLHGRS